MGSDSSLLFLNAMRAGTVWLGDLKLKGFRSLAGPISPCTIIGTWGVL